MNSPAEIRASITARIIEALKSGKAIPWRKPWRGIDGPRLPTNLVTGRAYQGMNVMLLWLAAQQRGYRYDYWATYQQFRSMGAQVRRGEKATQIILWKPVKTTVKDKDGEEREKSFPLLRTWSVFNVSQTEGESVRKYQEKEPPLTFDHSDRDEFDRVVAATGADIRFGFDQAAYIRPPDDYVTMPDEGRFLSFPAFAETLFHEVGGHWTESRLDWTGSYAAGELRAEITATYLSAALNIPDSGDLTNHVAYLQHWLQALKNDDRFLFTASSAASKAADFFLSFSRSQEEAEGEVEVEAVA